MHTLHVNQLVLPVKQPILNDNRDFVLAGRQLQGMLLGVVDQHGTRQAVVDLFPRHPVRVRVI